MAVSNRRRRYCPIIFASSCTSGLLGGTGRYGRRPYGGYFYFCLGQAPADPPPKAAQASFILQAQMFSLEKLEEG